MSGKNNSFISNLIDQTISVFFYRECLLCSSNTNIRSDVCQKCHENLSTFKLSRCKICSVGIESGSICGQCSLKKPNFKRHISFGDYRGDLRKLILLYKFNGNELIKYYFSKILINLMKEEYGFLFDYIVPVPGDHSRKRSFDPVLEISKQISKKTGIPVLKNRLVKIKKTEPQSGLGYKKRIKNLNGAFSLKKNSIIKEMRLLLVDDVYTTGTTIKKCIDTLKKETEDIYAITIARSKDLPVEI